MAHLAKCIVLATIGASVAASGGSCEAEHCEHEDAAALLQLARREAGHLTLETARAQLFEGSYAYKATFWSRSSTEPTGSARFRTLKGTAVFGPVEGMSDQFFSMSNQPDGAALFDSNLCLFVNHQNFTCVDTAAGGSRIEFMIESPKSVQVVAIYGWTGAAGDLGETFGVGRGSLKLQTGAASAEALLSDEMSVEFSEHFPKMEGQSVEIEVSTMFHFNGNGSNSSRTYVEFASGSYDFVFYNQRMECGKANSKGRYVQMSMAQGGTKEYYVCMFETKTQLFCTDTQEGTAFVNATISSSRFHRGELEQLTTYAGAQNAPGGNLSFAGYGYPSYSAGAALLTPACPGVFPKLTGQNYPAQRTAYALPTGNLEDNVDAIIALPTSASFNVTFQANGNGQADEQGRLVHICMDEGCGLGMICVFEDGFRAMCVKVADPTGSMLLNLEVLEIDPSTCVPGALFDTIYNSYTTLNPEAPSLQGTHLSMGFEAPV